MVSPNRMNRMNAFLAITRKSIKNDNHSYHLLNFVVNESSKRKEKKTMSKNVIIFVQFDKNLEPLYFCNFFFVLFQKQIFETIQSHSNFNHLMNFCVFIYFFLSLDKIQIENFPRTTSSIYTCTNTNRLKIITRYTVSSN